MPELSRRRFVTGSLHALACAPFLRIRAAHATEAFTPLRQLAQAKGIDFGFAVNPAELDDNPLYRDFVAREASVVVPENALKWASVHPKPGTYDFAPSDRIAAFAQAHGQHMRGHTFCWHRALPDWVSKTVLPANAEGVLTDHIANLALVSVRQNEVVKRLAGWGAILAVPTVVFSLYGMNFQNMPELKVPWGYHLTLLLTFTGCVAIYWRLKRSKWV